MTQAKPTRNICASDFSKSPDTQLTLGNKIETVAILKIEY